MWRVFVFFFVFTANGQLIENQNGQAFTNTPFFNANIIAPLKIQSIEGFYTYKSAESTFKPSLDWCRYRFNENGQVIEHLEVLQKGKQKDSTLHQFAYHPNGQLAVHRYPAYGGAISEHFQYDSLKRLISISYYRDQFKENLLNNPAAVLMRQETLMYHQNQVHNFTQFNQYKLPFMDVSLIFNQDGYLLEREQYYRMNQQSQKELFRYNEKGLLTEKSLQTETTQEAETWNYRYDQWGNIIEVLHNKNKQVLNELQIIYDYKTGYLGSVIYKDLKSNQLKIIRFTKYTSFN
ncbi:MAG: hypothetical protein ACKOBN_03540 [Flavobacteriales bacterium]